MTAKPFVIPEVNDTDIDRLERLLDVSFDGPRREVLKCNESVDVQACPGSGKTTLLVAKLAILAGKWIDARRGICVLSHTNVAREQVEKKLVATVEGERLLAYPHFIGTIHSFVNQFVALPCLRSDGFVIQVIDNEVCGAKCRSLLYRSNAYKTARDFLRQAEKKTPNRSICNLRYEGPDMDLGSAAGNLPCGKHTPSYSELHAIKKQVANDGYWRYDDMFAAAARQLKDWPAIVDILRQRFPAVFTDETQDTSEMQNALLATLFPSGTCAIRQRFGDSNQAIYDWGQSEATSGSDIFPCSSCLREIPNSKRFGNWIACTADPLAHTPVTPTLCGEGPSRSCCCADPVSMQHTVFLFEPATCQLVFQAFGDLLLNSFSDVDLRNGYFTAVGHIGKPSGSQDHFPRSLRDYWPDYESEATRLEPRPSTLAEYVHFAQRQKYLRGRTTEAVETVARGIIEILRLADPKSVWRHGRPHRSLQQVLDACGNGVEAYRRLIWRWCVAGDGPSTEAWDADAEGIRTLLKPLLGERWSAEAENFLQWSDVSNIAGIAAAGSRPAPPNVLRYTNGNRSVDIHVGTIHSAKGQTHTATLVLETYFREHDLSDLLSWLTGEQRGWKKANGIIRGERLRLIYTAMTRPTHLLCLAIRRGVFGEDLSASQVAATLRDRGWRIEEVL
jgi:hypothetical protein